MKTIIDTSGVWSEASLNDTVDIRCDITVNGNVSALAVSTDGALFDVTSYAPNNTLRDGTVDWGPYVQVALNAAKITGGIVYIPPGDYGVSGNFGLTDATGVVIRGAGMGSTILRSIEPQSTYGDPTGAYYGMLSFVTSDRCGIENLTLIGQTTIGQGAGLAGKGTFHRNSSNCWVRGVEVTEFYSEAIYADGDCPRWAVQFCYVHDGVQNGINLNCASWSSAGAIITNNYSSVNTGGSAIIVAGNSAIISNNVMRMIGPAGADICVIDVSSRCVVTNNMLIDSDIYTAGVSALHLFGTSTATATHVISNNVFSNISGSFHLGAVMTFTNFTGSASVIGNQISNCGNNLLNQRAFWVTGSAGHIYIAGNCIRKSNRNLDIAVYVSSGTTPTAVTIGENDFSECLTPYFLSASTLGRGLYSPESVITAQIGSTYIDVSGGAGATFYVKETGTGNTGWAAK